MMKRLLTLLGVLAVVAGTSWAGIPEPDNCSVMPCDGLDYPRIFGSPDLPGAVGYANLDIYVRDHWDNPIQDEQVQVLIEPVCLVENGGAVVTCHDSYTGTTDEDGHVVINMALGGCCSGGTVAQIVCLNVVIRAYEDIVSPDYDGTTGDGAVNAMDLAYFGVQSGAGSPGCTDYNGDGTTNALDVAYFGSSWGHYCD